MKVTAEALVASISDADLFRRTGTVIQTSGDNVTANGINFKTNELAVIEAPGGPLIAQCAGMRDGESTLALLDRGVVPVGARVIATGTGATAPVGEAVLGRIVDGLGRPLDGGTDLWRPRQAPVHAEPPSAMRRGKVSEQFPTGIRVIDSLLTLARGQRIGIFSGSGVGKSTLLGMLARGADADVVVIALIGERGREVREFIEHDLGPEALKRATVVVATGDATPAMRLNAALAATAVAEGHRGRGRDVLLLFDSLTRVAMAQREIGLAAGEPPATRGYPPSVFGILPHLMERTGPGPTGSITAIYSILADSDEIDDPISEIARATLDGHVMLKRSLAGAGHYPPIDILESASRLMPRVTSEEHGRAAALLRELLGAYEDARDLISIGAYVEGTDPVVDRAVALMPRINELLRQRTGERQPFDETVEQLIALVSAAAPEVDALEVTSDGAIPRETEAASEAA
jgi:flagellum-specific ATP synthase